jgi:hypothetical protein
MPPQIVSEIVDEQPESAPAPTAPPGSLMRCTDERRPHSLSDGCAQAPWMASHPVVRATPLGLGQVTVLDCRVSGFPGAPTNVFHGQGCCVTGERHTVWLALSPWRAIADRLADAPQPRGLVGEDGLVAR